MQNFIISFIITIILLNVLIWGKDKFIRNGKDYWLLGLLIFVISLLITGYFTSQL
jgi:hypothetical protein